MPTIRHAFSCTISDGTNTALVKPSDWNATHNFTGLDAVLISGNTSGVTAQITSGSVLFAGGNNITLSQNQNSITISAFNQTSPVAGSAIQVVGTATGSGTNTTRFAPDDHIHAGVIVAGISGGNTSGQTGTRYGSVLFAGGSNITLSGGTGVGGQTITISGASQSVQTQNVVVPAGSNTTFTSGTVVYTGSNALTVRSGAQAIILDVPMGATATGNLGGIIGSDATYTSGSVQFTGSNIVTVRSSAGQRIVIDASQSIQPAVGMLNNSSGTMSISGGTNITVLNNNSTITIQGLASVLHAVSVSGNTGTTGSSNVFNSGFVLAGGSNVTLSQSNNSISIHASGGGGGGTTNQTGPNIGVSNLGNTAGTTGTISTGTYVLAGIEDIQLSQSLQAVGSNATVSIRQIPLSVYRVGGVVTTIGTAQGNSLVSIQPFILPKNLVVSNILFAKSVNVGTTGNNSSAYLDVSVSAVIYTRTGSTLNSLASMSNSFTLSWSSNATGSATGVFGVFATGAPITLTAGEYYLALHLSTTNTATGGTATTALGNTITMVLHSTVASAVQLARQFGSGTASTLGLVPGLGVISTNATRVSMAFSDIVMTGTRAVLAPIYFEMRNVSVLL